VVRTHGGERAGHNNHMRNKANKEASSAEENETGWNK